MLIGFWEALMGGIFWDFATSYIILSAIGLVFIAALIVGYFPLLKWFPVVGQYVPVARLVVVIAASLLCFLIGFRVSNERAEANQLRIDLSFKQLELDAQRQAAETAAALRAKAEARAATLEKKVQDYEDELAKKPAGDGTLDDGDVRSLRRIAE